MCLYVFVITRCIHFRMYLYKHSYIRAYVHAMYVRISVCLYVCTYMRACNVCKCDVYVCSLSSVYMLCIVGGLFACVDVHIFRCVGRRIQLRVVDANLMLVEAWTVNTCCMCHTCVHPCTHWFIYLQVKTCARFGAAAPVFTKLCLVIRNPYSWKFHKKGGWVRLSPQLSIAITLTLTMSVSVIIMCRVSA
jgi:hypothetical protein